VLFVNPRSGDGKAERAAVAERARELGIEVVLLDPGQSPAAAVREAVEAGADALGVAGGDGSLAVVASAAVEHGLPFVCVPAGTRNHFARDLGLDPHDPAGALDAFADGVERRIDVGDVSGRLFLNNVSLGIYGEAVRQAGYRDARLRTLLDTADEVLRGGVEIPELRLLDRRGREHRGPDVVLVSNNPYAPAAPPRAGGRPALDGGVLGVIVLDPPSGGRPAGGRSWSAESVEVEAPSVVHAGIDGEAADLEPPLRFAIRPGALRVRVPARAAGRG